MNNKKLLMFGLLGIFSIMLVTAGLVSYLSNTVESKVVVSSPITFTTENTETENVFGGQIFTTQATVVNNIDEGITGVLQATITNNLGNATCDDYEITVDIIDGPGATSDIPLMSLPNMYDDTSYGCNDDEAITTIRIPVKYGPKETQSYNLNLKFAKNVAPTKYFVEGQIMIAPTA